METEEVEFQAVSFNFDLFKRPLKAEKGKSLREDLLDENEVIDSTKLKALNKQGPEKLDIVDHS